MQQGHSTVSSVGIYFSVASMIFTLSGVLCLAKSKGLLFSLFEITLAVLKEWEREVLSRPFNFSTR